MNTQPTHRIAQVLGASGETGELVLRCADGGAASALSRETLVELIDAQLTSVYHCTRVWEAWGCGTMSEDDFTEARGSSLAGEIADEVLAVLSGCTADSIPNAGYLLGHQHGLDWAAQLANGCDPRTGDWLYDDREDLANAIHRGPEMPAEWSAALQGGDAEKSEGWLPISSAPKDGTHILVSWPMRLMDDEGAPTGDITRRDTLVTWMNGGAWIEPDYLGASGDWYGDDDCYAADPDLWMPLPAAPSTQGATP